MATPDRKCPCGKWKLPAMSTGILMPDGQKIPRELLAAELIVTLKCPECGVVLQQSTRIDRGILMTAQDAEALIHAAGGAKGQGDLS